MNIYVGNMSFDTTENDLREAFAAFGDVTEVNVIMDRETGRPRGFAFIEMSNADEGKAAIEGLNLQKVGGRAVTVNEARPRDDRGGGRRGGGGGRGGRW
jgi:cold-inducible RNA-binding protein